MFCYQWIVGPMVGYHPKPSPFHQFKWLLSNHSFNFWLVERIQLIGGYLTESLSHIFNPNCSMWYQFLNIQMNGASP